MPVTAASRAMTRSRSAAPHRPDRDGGAGRRRPGRPPLLGRNPRSPPRSRHAIPQRLMQIKPIIAFRCQINGYWGNAQPFGGKSSAASGRRSARRAGPATAAPGCDEEDGMKASLVPGVTSTSNVTSIASARSISWARAARVYATPMLVRDIEVACRELLLRTSTPARTRSARASRSTISPRRCSA